MDLFDKQSRELKTADGLYAKEEYKKALEIYLKVLKLKIEKGQSVDLGPYYQRIADSYVKMKPKLEEDREQNLKKAAQYYVRAAEKYEASNDYHDAGVAYESAANCFELVEEHDQASSYDKKSADMFSQSEEGFQASHTFLQSAQYAEESGDFRTAADSYVKAAEMDVDLKDERKASESYFKAGLCFERLEDYDKAIEYYLLSSGIFDKVKNYEKAAYAYEGVGRCKEKLGNFDDALKYYFRASNISESEKNFSSLISNYMNIGRSYEKLDRIEEASKYYVKAADISSEQDDLNSQAIALKEAAKCFKQIGDLKNALTNYISSAEAYISASKRFEAHEVLRKALEISLAEAQKNEKKGDFENASYYNKQASYCYYNMKDYERAADLYFKYAQSKEKAGDTDEANEGYIRSAESYEKSEILNKAGDAYNKARMFEEASACYESHAKNSSRKKKYFEAGKYYGLAAWCQKKLDKHKEERELMNKSIWEYTAYLSAEKDNLKPPDEARANLRIGEGHLKLDDNRKAMNYLQKATDLYREIGNKKMLAVSEAQLSMVVGRTALQGVDYSKATVLFKKAVDLFDNMDSSGFDDYYLSYLSVKKSEAEERIKEIEAKPDVELSVEQPDSLLVNADSLLEGRIINNGTQLVEKIVFLTSPPLSLKVLDYPKGIAELKPGESSQINVKIRPTEVGKYVFSPLEVLYHDKGGRKYMKGSNELQLEVVAEKKEAPPQEAGASGLSGESVRVSDKIMRGFIEVEPDSIILISYNPTNHTQVISETLKKLVNERKEGGVYICISKPHKHAIALMEKNGIPTKDIKFIDCISRVSGKAVEKDENVVYVENPASLEEISMYSDKLMKEIASEKKFLFIDSLSSLLIYNEARAIEELIHFMVNQLRSDCIGGIILSAEESSTQNVVQRLTPACDKIIRV